MVNRDMKHAKDKHGKTMRLPCEEKRRKEKKSRSIQTLKAGIR